MQLFSTKMLGSYALAIVGAVVLFQLVTSYGEANVLAPPNIAGNYQVIAADLPSCLSNKQTSIDIQQSGIYLNASLTNSRKDRSKIKASPTLSGHFRTRQIDLVGTIPPAICPELQLKLVATVITKNAVVGAADRHDRRSDSLHQLQGQLWLTNLHQPTTPIAIPFTATQQAETQVQNTAH